MIQGCSSKSSSPQVTALRAQSSGTRSYSSDPEDLKLIVQDYLARAVNGNQNGIYLPGEARKEYSLEQSIIDSEKVTTGVYATGKKAHIYWSF